MTWRSVTGKTSMVKSDEDYCYSGESQTSGDDNEQVVEVVGAMF